MIRVLIRNWWLLALRGVLAMAFAVLVFSLRSLEESIFKPRIAARLPRWV